MLRTTLAILLLATLSTPASAAPNILLIMSDDQSYNDIGCYGSLNVKTPNIDKLASEGMRFTRCFTSTAMCSPTRQQLYTGIFPVRNGAYPNHSRVKPGTKSVVHYFRDAGYRVGLSGKGHIGPPESFPFEKLGGGPDYDKVKEFVNRDKKQPYCLIVTSHSPHSPWSKGDASAYPPEKLKLQPGVIDTPETRESLSRYYAEITDFDRELGICTKIVKESGQENDTIFIYTSEQGWAFAFGKWTCYDLGLRTGLVIRWPGHIEPGSVSDAMVQYVDIVPTLLDAVGQEQPKGLDGRSFLNVLTGKEATFRDYTYGAHTTRGIINATPSGYPIRSIRDTRYKYIMNLNHEATFNNAVTAGGRMPSWKSWVEKAMTDPDAAARVKMYQHRPAEEFYDLQEDPFELNNLSANPKHRHKMDNLQAKLRAWMKQQGDKGLETELASKRKKPKGKKPKK